VTIVDDVKRRTLLDLALSRIIDVAAKVAFMFAHVRHRSNLGQYSSHNIAMPQKILLACTLNSLHNLEKVVCVVTKLLREHWTNETSLITAESF
jgi:hypothetical protein